MELQGLQEALKVEIQCHQKLAVRACPVGSPKPLSLIKPSTQSIAISVLPAKAPVSMVTAHINGQKAAVTAAAVGAAVGAGAEQASPINLQTAARVTASAIQPPYARRVGELPHSPMLGTLTAVPIKVPQVSSLHRLAGQAPTVLPQVRPKTLIPESLPMSPCQEQPTSQPTPMPISVSTMPVSVAVPMPVTSPISIQPLSLTRGAVVLSPRSQSKSQSQAPSPVPLAPAPTSATNVTAATSATAAALPTANSTFSPERHQTPPLTPQPNGHQQTTPSDRSQATPPYTSPANNANTSTLTIASTATAATVPSPVLVSMPTATPMPTSPTAAAVTSPGVAYAIISTPTVGSNGIASASAGEAVKVQPLLFSADNKVIIIQPQVTSATHDLSVPQADSQSQESSSSPGSPAKIKEEVDPEKIAFMVALGLVTTEHLEEIQIKRQERKRRSTANPAYSGLFEPERKRLASHYLSNPLFLSHRGPEDMCWKEELEHDDHCTVCKDDGELQQCHSCPRAYHLDCLHPPLKSPPKGPWMCPKCQKKVLNKENLAWPHNFVQSYVTHKTMKEDEKRKLLRRNCELKKECAHLREQDKILNCSLTKCMDLKERLLGQQRETQASLERLKGLIRLIQRDQVIQVTMTATTTTTAGASLLSLPWIKPTSSGCGGSSSGSGESSPSSTTAPPMGHSVLLQKSLSQPQGNN